jgi:hypothetical protein
MTPRDTTIVVLSKYPTILEQFVKYKDLYAKDTRCVLVVDGGSILKEHIPYDWHVVYGPQKFSMAGNATMGWMNVPYTNDILYMGDDVLFQQPNTVEELRRLAYSDPKIGMLSPRIIGGADNPLQKQESDKELIYSNRYLALVCTFIKREVVDKVGYLDDKTFVGYGWEDCDYSRRVVNAGYKLAVAPQLYVQHGVFRVQNPETGEGVTGRGTETFMRNENWEYDKIQEQTDVNKWAYEHKWKDTKQEF